MAPEAMRAGRVAIAIALIAGLVHAAASFYWAAGGRFLLDTVGAWAVHAAENSPVAARWAMAGLGVVKTIAAVIPYGVSRGWVPLPRFWRAVSWVGGSVLVLYGAVNIVVSGAVLTGIAPSPPSGIDSAAMLGHVALWDPLFLIWGLALLAWLTVTRREASLDVK